LPSRLTRCPSKQPWAERAYFRFATHGSLAQKSSGRFVFAQASGCCSRRGTPSVIGSLPNSSRTTSLCLLRRHTSLPLVAYAQLGPTAPQSDTANTPPRHTAFCWAQASGSSKASTLVTHQWVGAISSAYHCASSVRMGPRRGRFSGPGRGETHSECRRHQHLMRPNTPITLLMIWKPRSK
jgi:hypothetical protein